MFINYYLLSYLLHYDCLYNFEKFFEQNIIRHLFLMIIINFINFLNS